MSFLEAPETLRKNWLGLPAFLFLTLLVGFLASQVTTPNIAAWYDHLVKPSFNPPNTVFMPVWTVLYVLMAVAAWRVWCRTGLGSRAMAVWFLQLLLNFAWSFLFFGAHSPMLAFFEIVVLWFTILWTVGLFWQTYIVAGILLIPYLSWVAYAAALNFWIWQLNS